jgi:hypothetical protein
MNINSDNSNCDPTPAKESVERNNQTPAKESGAEDRQPKENQRPN